MSLLGRWRIRQMDLWDLEDIDLMGPAFVEFGQDRTGHFRFIAVEGWMDCRPGPTGEHPRVEFTWEGDEDGDRASGRGWASQGRDGPLHGHVYFHLGDDSGFRAVRAAEKGESKAPG